MQINSPKKVNKKTHPSTISLISFSAVIFIMLFSHMLPNSFGMSEDEQGNTIVTWIPWKLSDNKTLTIDIVNSNFMSHDKIDAVKDAILSEDTIKIVNPHLGEQVYSVHEYFKGWKGALESASTNGSKFYIPTKFIFVDSPRDADIVINLTNSSSDDLYSAYTKPILKADHVIKTQIIIYKVYEYSADRLAGIVRHEFGHALGLGHSTEQNDLMYYLLNTDYPYISTCDVYAIRSLYDGKESSNVTCQ